MGKGIGIAALVFAIIAIFVPVFGIMVGWLALFLATLAALFGDKTFTIAALVITAVNYFFLSPLLWVSGSGGNETLIYISLGMLAAPVLGLLLHIAFGPSRKALND
jgi:hypothetical protein